jgi:hypothetical protein
VIDGQAYLDDVRDLHDRWLHDRLGPGTNLAARDELLGFPMTEPMRRQVVSVSMTPWPGPAAYDVWLMASEDQTSYQVLRQSLEDAGAAVRYGVVPGDGDWQRLDVVHQTLLPHAMVRAITAAMAS